MRMKILIICNCATGLEIFRGMLIRKLVKEGNVVTAIVPQTNDKKEKDAEDGLKKMRCNLIRIPIERRGMNPFRDIQLFLEYYRTVKKIKPELVITYTIKVNNHLKPAFGAVKLNSLSAPAIQKLYNDMQKGRRGGKAYSAKAIKDLHGVLHKALQQAVQIGYLRFNPSDSCTLPRDKTF